jgi:NAD(P)-dependent dehydrogenase (short-subunit alcohol dehydrogenase family)
MSNGKKVVVYGASGYTGRLVCEYLREFGVPFIAAGRDKARIAEALGTVPGIDTVEHDIVEVAHEAEPLKELFDGASVVCNMVGPFAQYGAEVVEACLAVGAHYLDTTGEQDWLIAAEEEFGQRMASAGLLLAPGVAQMYTTGEIAAVPGGAGPGHPGHPGLLEGHAHDRLHPHDLGQRRPRQGVLPGAEPVRGMAGRRGPVQRDGARPA